MKLLAHDTEKRYLILRSLNTLSGKVNEVITMLLLMKIRDGFKRHLENKPDN